MYVRELFAVAILVSLSASGLCCHHRHHNETLSETKPVRVHEKLMCFELKEKLELLMNEDFTTYEPLSYRYYISGYHGTIFFIKVHIGDGNCVHIKVVESHFHLFHGRTLHLEDYRYKDITIETPIEKF